ncbi:MAG: dihydrofolate reductase family protein [Acidimicrobiales bacterium]
MRLTLHSFMTLDGVLQAPGGPDEDRDGGFAYGGWSFAHGDEECGEAMAGWIERADAFLLGRRTYDIFAAYWPKITDPSNPIAAKLNGLEKFVASRSLSSLDWEHSSLLTDVPAGVADLKRRPGGELQVHGSGNLARTLIEHDLVDEYRLLVYPLLLGSGKRLFTGGGRGAALRLTGARTTGAGVVVYTGVPDGPVRQGSYPEA